MLEQVRKAVSDFMEGARMARLWVALGWDQTLARFQRTLLGPFWLSSTLLAMAVSLSFVFGGLLGVNWREGFPFVLFGVLAWGLVGGAVADGANMFLGSANVMQVQRFPLTFFAFLHLFRAVVNFIAQLIAAIVVAAAVGLLRIPHWTVLPGLMLVCMISFFLALIVAIPSTRFRDVGHLAGLVMSILFFVTPVFWHPANMSASRRIVFEYNPLAHELELIRQPLLGKAPLLADWLWSLGTLAAAALVATVMLSVVRKRVVFWL